MQIRQTKQEFNFNKYLTFEKDIDPKQRAWIEVVCWQEKFKKRPIIDKITVGDGDVTKDFTFRRPKKK